ncbi:hypothetical protein BJF83_20530 [Nocardiopsis sp. CNR-923]|nr:hypothetical protein BJF83_20530 [Nocardiopsis sp. CNR-923]
MFLDERRRVVVAPLGSPVLGAVAHVERAVGEQEDDPGGPRGGITVAQAVQRGAQSLRVVGVVAVPGVAPIDPEGAVGQVLAALLRVDEGRGAHLPGRDLTRLSVVAAKTHHGHT